MMDQPADKQLMALRVIVGAMAFGIVVFSVVTVFAGATISQATDASLARILYVVLGVVAVCEVPAFFIIRQVVLGRAIEASRRGEGAQDPVKEALQPYATITVIGAAMVEGLGLFGAAICLVTGDRVALVVSGICMIMLLLVFFPRRAKLQAIAERFAGRML